MSTKSAWNFSNRQLHLVFGGGQLVYIAVMQVFRLEHMTVYIIAKNDLMIVGKTDAPIFH